MAARRGSEKRVAPHHAVWWYEERTPGQWVPFWPRDSRALESAYTSGGGDTPVLVRASRAQVVVSERVLIPTLSQEPRRAVRRGTIFYATSGSSSSTTAAPSSYTAAAPWVPHEERVAEEISGWLDGVLAEAAAAAPPPARDPSAPPPPALKRNMTTGGFSLTATAVFSAQAHGLAAAGALPIPGPGGGDPVGYLSVTQAPTGSWLAGGVALRLGVPAAAVAAADEAQADVPVGHLVFVVHGIGEALWSRSDISFPGLIESVDAMNRLSLQLQREANGGALPAARVEYVPITWHSCVHEKDRTLSTKLSACTLPTVPFVRTLANEVVLDVLLYSESSFGDRIRCEVRDNINQAFTSWHQLFPGYTGPTSVIGHSLGSVISFDLLNNSVPTEPIAPPMAASSASSTPPQRLDLDVQCLFLVGSPVALFQIVRERDVERAAVACRTLMNIFHPSDAVAYRLDPLLGVDPAAVDPVVIPHHQGGHRLHTRVKEATKSVMKAWSFVASLAGGSSGTAVAAAPPPALEDAKTPEGGGAERVDHQLEVSDLEAASSQYLSVLTAHVSYFESLDMLKHVLKVLRPEATPPPPVAPSAPPAPAEAELPVATPVPYANG